MIRLYLLFALTALPATADTVVATRTIRAQSEITQTDVKMTVGDVPGGINHVSNAVGKEARVTLYAGRPIQEKDIGPLSIVDRNQLITITYIHSGLSITAEGRALSRGGVGDKIRIMNLASRATISGVILEDGSVMVGQE